MIKTLTDNAEIVMVYVEDSRYSAMYLDGKLIGEFKDITADDILDVLKIDHRVVYFGQTDFPENFDETMVVQEFEPLP